MSNPKVRSHGLKAVGGLEVADSAEFPLSPKLGLLATVNGDTVLYTRINGVDAFYPIVKGADSATYQHQQSTPSLVWNMPHGLNTKDFFMVVRDENGVIQLGYEDIEYVVGEELNRVKVTFSEAIKGTATFYAPKSMSAPRINTSEIVLSDNFKINGAGLVYNGQVLNLASLANLSTEVTDAKTKATAAQQDAATALSRANSAINTADAANNSVIQLTSTVNAANQAASNAATVASTAKSTADTAKTTADAAKSTADAAKVTADANTTAINTVSGVANTAKSTADTAKSTADTAKATADSAAASIATLQSNVALAARYDIPWTTDDAITAGYSLGRALVPLAVKVPANFAGSAAIATVAPTVTTVFNIRIGSTVIGTVTFAAGQTTGTFGNAAAQTIPANSRVEIVAVGADTTLRNVDITVATSAI